MRTGCMAQSTFAIPLRRDKPWLLPSNRKLRNIVSISLRNLSATATSPKRQRGKTIDDDAIPRNLQSPAKLVALRERKALGQSRSSSDLRAVAEHTLDNHDENNVPARLNGSPTQIKNSSSGEAAESGSPSKRPGIRRMRRRSTLEWANATPQRRQEKLEDVIHERMVDVFFTLHVQGIEEPVYVSEMVEKTINPTFRNVDWTLCGPGITRLDKLVLKVWVRGGRVQGWKQSLQLRLEMGGLHYLGKSLDHLDRALAPNAIIFHLTDGIYVPHTGSLSDFVPGSKTSERPASSASKATPTSSFDALLRLAKLDDSIQDALAVRDEIASDLERLLVASKTSLVERDQVAEATDRLKTIEFAQKTVEKQLEKARSQKAEKRTSLDTRRKLMALDRAHVKSASAHVSTTRPEFPSLSTEHGAKSTAVHAQRRRICEDLQDCYPIPPLPGKTLAFAIRGLHLPNSEALDAESPDIVAAALGHVAHMLQLLAFYLSHPLPYPVLPRGSSSSILDPLSILKTSAPLASAAAETKLRTYPLFAKGVPRFRFEYAVFLLNQDIRVLMENALGVKVADVRQTLPNLKYLFYVATAGEGELPARKAGGVRGLLNVGATGLERVGSRGSHGSVDVAHGNGNAKGAMERLKEVSGRG